MANKRLSLIVQAGRLKSLFPDSIIKRHGEDSLIWIYTIIPTPVSNRYKVQLIYKKGKGVSFFVLEPKLKLAEGEKKLPHVYSTERQELCLFHPKEREWHAGLEFVKTLIPWASEWLLHYEIWASTGHWHGGGIHPSINVDEVDEEIRKVNEKAEEKTDN